MLGRLRGTLIIGACLAATVLALAACGASTSRTSSRATTSAPGTADVAYAKTDPAQILKDAVTAMSAATSFQAVGQIDLQGTNAAATIAVKVPSAIEASIQTGPELIKLIVLGSDSYLYANTTFWQKEAGASSAAAVARFADKWFKAPAATTTGLSKDLGNVTPRQLAVCLSQASTKPTVTGTSTVKGQATVELHLAGGKPGSSPGNLFVAAASPHYPVRFTQTGKALSGGTGACANGPTDSDNGKGRLDFSGWNATTISAPANAGTLPH